MDRKQQQNKVDQRQTNETALSKHSANPTNTPRPMSQTNETGSTKKISSEKMQRRREKRLCLNCNEKFTSRHCCATSQAFVIEVCPHQEFLEGGGDVAWDDKPCGQGPTSWEGE